MLRHLYGHSRGGPRRRRHWLFALRDEADEEPVDLDAEEPGRRPELGGRDAIGAPLVFLDLLKGQAEGLGQIGLGEPQKMTAQGKAGPDVAIQPLLQAGDTFVVSYSGHGGQDRNSL